MNTINVTITFDKESKQLLEGLMGSVTLLSTVLAEAQPKEVQQDIIENLGPAVKEEATTEAPADPEPAAETELVAESAPEVKPVSLAEFQKAVTLAVSKGADAKQAVKTIINKYAASVSAVPENKRADIIAELSSI